MDNHPHAIGVGVMSGTSLDGIDLCLASFNDIGFSILSTHYIPYNEYWINRLSQAHKLFGKDLVLLDNEYGKFIGQSVLDFINQHSVYAPSFIASHGHTIFHSPQDKTCLQIGTGHAIAAICKRTTVYNFRALDIALGGQGAPLVPVGDRDLFSEFDFCLNLGGFANISYQKDNQRLAHDICPVNIILNELSKKLGKAFDNKGKIASQGKIINDLLDKLNCLQFYIKVPPKSLAKEWTDHHILPLLSNRYKIEDLLCTFTHHIVRQIVNATKSSKRGKILITGGGAYNDYLIQLLQKESVHEVIKPSKEIINFKESLIFAYLGYLRLHTKVNTLSSVTGAKQDSCSGDVIYI